MPNDYNELARTNREIVVNAMGRIEESDMSAVYVQKTDKQEMYKGKMNTVFNGWGLCWLYNIPPAYVCLKYKAGKIETKMQETTTEGNQNPENKKKVLTDSFSYDRNVSFMGYGRVWLWSGFGLGQRMAVVDPRMQTVLVLLKNALSNEPYEISIAGVVNFQIKDIHKMLRSAQDPVHQTAMITSAYLRKIAGDNTIDNLNKFQEETAEQLNSKYYEMERMGLELISIRPAYINIPNNIAAMLAQKGEALYERDSRIILSEARKAEMIAVAEGLAAQKQLVLEGIGKAGESFKNPAGLVIKGLEEIATALKDQGKTTLILNPQDIINAGRDLLGMLNQYANTVPKNPTAKTE